MGLKRTLAGKTVGCKKSKPLAKKKDGSDSTTRKALRDIQQKPKRKVRLSKLKQVHKDKRVACAKQMLSKYGAEGKEWKNNIYTDFSAYIRLNKVSSNK